MDVDQEGDEHVYAAWHPIWTGLLGGGGARKRAVASFAKLDPAMQCTITRRWMKQLLGPIGRWDAKECKLVMYERPWDLPDAGIAAQRLPRGDPENWRQIHDATSTCLNGMFDLDNVRVESADKLDVLDALLSDTYSPARRFAVVQLPIYHRLDPARLEARLPALLADEEPAIRYTTLRFMTKCVASDTLERLKTAIALLKQDPNDRVMEAATLLLKRDDPPPAPVRGGKGIKRKRGRA